METISKQIFNKISCAKDIIAEIKKIGELEEFIQTKEAELDSINNSFIESTCYLMSDLASRSITNHHANMEFATILARENFARNIDNIVELCQKYLENNGIITSRYRSTNFMRKKVITLTDTKQPLVDITAIDSVHLCKIKEVLYKYPYSKKDTRGNIIQDELDGNITIINMMLCICCGGEYTIDAKKTELKCQCGNITNLFGMCLDDDYSKFTSFNTNRHYYKWMRYILALESESEIGDASDPENAYGEKLLVDMKKLIEQNKKILRKITVDDTRHMLLRLGKSKLYNHAPLIMKKLTGIGPPEYDMNTFIMLENAFVEVVDIINKLYKEERTNKKYYPNYIARIVDAKIPEDDYERRRILYYIYIQKEDTVAANDENWRTICEMWGKVQYKPLDRKIGEKYAPVA